ncbi:hypothetical protein TNCV_4386421 [Trichonephila clavipes]|nr:hypothetical protein TNCV_4386421 [Trichonephila clavipes]
MKKSHILLNGVSWVTKEIAKPMEVHSQKVMSGGWRKRATARTLSRCLGVRPAVPKVSHGFPKLVVFLGHGSTFVNVCGYNVLCSSKGQGSFRLRRLGSLLGFLDGSLTVRDPNLT